MKKIFFATLMVFFFISAYSQVWISSNAGVTFFSESPLENIEATTNKGMTALNTQTGNIYFKIVISSFEFKSSLMKEHFNENYMESDEYPNAEFKGVIENMPDFGKEGIYEVKVKGKLTVHGVTKDRSVNGTITVGKGKISVNSRFKIRCAEHNIEIPSLVTKNIAEEVEVTISCNYAPKI